MELRVRLLWGWVEAQTSQGHPMTGTPTEVPVPRKVRVEDMLACWADDCIIPKGLKSRC